MESGLSPAAKVVLYYLHKSEFVENGPERVYHSNIFQMASRVGMSRITVRRCVRDIEAAGYIEILGRSEGRNAGFVFVIREDASLHKKNYVSGRLEKSGRPGTEYILYPCRGRVTFAERVRTEFRKNSFDPIRERLELVAVSHGIRR